MKSLSTHIAWSHRDIGVKGYYDKFIKKDEDEGKCQECGKETKFLDLKRGYKGFCCPRCSTKNIKVQEKLKQTMLRKYGVENCAQNIDITEKINETKSKRNLEFQEKGYTQVKDLIDLYGYGWYGKKIVPIVRYLNHGYVKNEDVEKIVEYSNESHYGTPGSISNKEKELVDYIR